MIASFHQDETALALTVVYKPVQRPIADGRDKLESSAVGLGWTGLGWTGPSGDERRPTLFID